MTENQQTSDNTSISNEGSQSESTGAETVESTETVVDESTTQEQDSATEANQQDDEQSQGTESGDAETSATESEAGDQSDGDQEQSSSDDAPETYELVAPEGKDLDPTVLETFSESAKELGLSQENAQEILSKVGPKITERLDNRVKEVVAGWEKQSRNDPLIGGSGDNEILNKNLAVANRSIDTFGDTEYQELLDSTGMGSHPAVIRMHLKLGKFISEDSFVGSGNNNKGKTVAIAGIKSIEEMAETAYPKQTQ